jgi:hypothetical protein
MVGYVFSILATTLSASLFMCGESILWIDPKDGLMYMKWWCHFYPSFPFTRVMYKLSDNCGYFNCVKKW